MDSTPEQGDELLVDEALADELFRIAEAGDDPDELMSINSVDPEQFAAFLEEIGTGIDPDVLELIRAAERQQLLRELAESGQRGSTQISPTHSPLWGRVRRAIEELDRRINALIPQQIISPTRNNDRVDFSTEKLLVSLATLGIPLQDGIQIAAGIEQHLLNVIPEGEDITTTHLRQAIIHSIYNLETAPSRRSAVIYWGDRYARRYGSPDDRIRVVYDDGSFDMLDYQYLTKRFIPHLAEIILRVPFEQARVGGVGVSDTENMAKELLDVVKAMNLYRINHHTLLAFAEDVATQPPHPWFVAEARSSATVQYDLDRARAHVEELTRHLGDRHLAALGHSCTHCVHHSCSAILAYYGAFLGSKHLHPLFRLISELRMLMDGDNPLLWSFHKFAQIEGDLAAVGYAPTKLMALLQKIARNINSTPEHKLKMMADLATRLYEVADRMINSRMRNIDSRITLREGEPTIPKDSLDKVVWEIFRRVPGIEPITAPTVERDWFWVRHAFSSEAGEAAPDVLTICVPREQTTSRSSLNHRLKLAAAEFEREEMQANTAIVVTDGPSSLVSELAQSTLGENIRGALIDVEDVVALDDSRDRAATFREILQSGREMI